MKSDHFKGVFNWFNKGKQKQNQSGLKTISDFKNPDQNIDREELLGTWFGIVTREDEEFRIRLVVKETNPDILGKFQLLDDFNNKWLEIGILESVVFDGNALKGSTNSGLGFSMLLEKNQLLGAIDFPETGANPSFSATSELHFESKIYLPLVQN